MSQPFHQPLHRILMTLALLVGTALAPWSLTAPITAQEKTEEPIEIKGEIKEDDTPDPVRKVPGKVHEVKLGKGKAYVITLVSSAFDSYLRLADAAGEEIASDDDSGGGSNSKIKYTPTGDVTVKIYVTTFAGGTGAYTLTVLPPGAVPKKVVVKNDPNPGKAEVVLDVNGQLQNNDPNDPARQQPCKVHEVKLKKGVAYQIDMTSGQFDSYLRLESPDGQEVARDDDGGGFPSARIKYTPTVDGAFKIFATRFGVGEGMYRLVCKSEGAIIPGKGNALPAPAANKPAQANAQLENNDVKDAVRMTPSKVFTIELKQGKTYTIDMTSGNFDTYLRLESPAGKNLAEDDDGGGNLNSRIVFNCTENGVYRIIATTFNGSVGQFNLSVAEQ